MNDLIEKNKKDTNKPLIIFLIIVLILGMGGISYFIYEMTYVNNQEEKKNNDKEEKKYTLDIYKYEDGRICGNKDDWCNTFAFSIETETNNATFLVTDNEYVNTLFVLYKDNGLKLYNTKTKETTKIDLEADYKRYSIYLNNAKNKVAGIIYELENDTKGYYNVLKNIKLYEGEYTYLNYLDENYLFGTTSKSGLIESKDCLLNANEENEELVNEKNEPTTDTTFFLESYNGKYYFFESYPDGTILKIYNNNKQIIYEKEIEGYQYSVVDGILYLVDGNVVKKYDTSGNLISTSKTLDNIKQLINDYAVYVNDNNLSLYNIDTKDTMAIANWKSNYDYDYYTSAYYNRETLDAMGETQKEEGVYLVITYDNQDASGNYGIEYCYNTKTKEIKTYNITEPLGGRAKPVLYLYPTKPTNIKVSFKYPEYLTTTYPKYNNSWEVKAYPNGDLYDKDGKYYYALYWDEKRFHEVNFHEGFYVEKENAIEFLEEKLSFIGLNDRERNEFIMYWLPILESNQKSLVYFELTEERESHNKLIIEPRPDSLLRISIHIKKVNEYINIKEQKLKTFNRLGFTAIEWGGMTY